MIKKVIKIILIFIFSIYFVRFILDSDLKDFSLIERFDIIIKSFPSFDKTKVFNQLDNFIKIGNNDNWLDKFLKSLNSTISFGYSIFNELVRMFQWFIFSLKMLFL